jgi:hypothetical protein
MEKTAKEQKLEKTLQQWVSFGEFLVKCPDVPAKGKNHVKKLLKASKEAMV